MREEKHEDPVRENSWTEMQERDPAGDQVLACRPGANVCRLLQPWVTGLWLGRDTPSDEHLTSTSAGVTRSRAPRRLQRTGKMGARSVERNALHTVVTTSESSWPPSFAETSI